MADEIASETKDKPAFDEQTLAKLLEAAFVLQEHNRELTKMELRARPAEPAESSAPTEKRSAEGAAKDDHTAILAQIVETQHQIQLRHLALDPAMALIVERIVDIARAAGASIGILDGRNLRYRASAGFRTLPVNTEVLLEKALCAASLRVGDVIRCADVNPEFLIDAAECKRRGIQSLICVPIYHNGQTAGGLEVYYSKTEGFSERDVHTCQLMAGLVTEALARNEDLTSKNSIAAERAVMLEAIEKLKPNLTALVDSTGATGSPPAVSAKILPPQPAAAAHCRKCGHALIADEQFCGECGQSRKSEYESPSMQSKVASMLSMQDAARKNASVNGSAAKQEPQTSNSVEDFNSPSASSLADAVENELPELFRLPDTAAARKKSSDAAAGSPLTVSPQSEDGVPQAKLTGLPAEEDVEDAEEETKPETALVRSGHPIPWSSAAAAREFLERIAGTEQHGPGALSRFLRARRGDVYLALAVLLVACVIRWGIWSNHSVSATGNSPAAASHRKPDADLPFFDWMLVKVGLADPPDVPEDKGKPDLQVWVDLQTALYYCPGTDLYRKTPKGKMETQRQAQLDQFEPASRKACN
jgi:GAF domain-containing protein